MKADKILELLKQSQQDQLELFQGKLADMMGGEPDRPAQTSLPPPPHPFEPRIVSKLVMKTQGEYSKGYPEGLVLHFTAGRYEKGVDSALSTVENGAKNGFAFWAMGTDGTIVKGHDIKKWGYHAGVSERAPLGSSVSKKLLGLEVCNAGKLTKDAKGNFTTWFGTTVPLDQVRYIPKARYPEEETGYYHAYTSEQETAIVNLILWLEKHGKGVFKLENVFGHDEVCMPRGRKNDPGGALALGMPEFRKALVDIKKMRQG